MFNFLKHLFSIRPHSVDEILAEPEGKRYYREHHSLRRESMDPEALKVINRLNRSGHRSYLVGGCVRDMILGRRPKDFDVVTTATPSQIRNLFSNSRAIGKRFKIVHVLFRGKIIEVSTFRSLPAHRLSGNKPVTDLMIMRDNDYGTPKEDAARRDFTINALFFDPRNESIIDYVGGYQDLKNRKISIIGNPVISFKEDPVRMVRAAKFGALLQFRMDSSCVRAIKKQKAEIARASQSRMLEEYNKIFRTGKATKIFSAFAECGLLKTLLPEVWEARDTPSKKAEFTESSLGKRLQVADRLLREREELTINIFMALILADLVKDILATRIKRNVIDFIKSRINPITMRLSFPKKDRDRLIQIYASQNRFSQTTDGPGFRPEFFRQKIFFYESFMFFKVNAIAKQDDESMQKAMFWEIGLRTRPPEKGKAINIFSNRRLPTSHSGRDRTRNRSRDGRSGTLKNQRPHRRSK